jgi:fructose-1,6-bisphosphatase I
MAFLVEQAGGKASNGTMRIMDVEPTEFHQRTPLIIGSANMVDQVVRMMGEGARI